MGLAKLSVALLLIASCCTAWHPANRWPCSRSSTKLTGLLCKIAASGLRAAGSAAEVCIEGIIIARTDVFAWAATPRSQYGAHSMQDLTETIWLYHLYGGRYPSSNGEPPGGALQGAKKHSCTGMALSYFVSLSSCPSNRHHQAPIGR